MKKRMIKLLSLALVVLTAFSVVGCGGCDWAMFDALFEIQPDVPSGEWESSNGNSLVTDKERGPQYWTEPPFNIILPPPLDFEGMKILFLTIDQDYYKREFYGVSYPDREGEEISLEEALAVRNDLVGETLNIEVDLEFAGADVESARANIADMIAKDLASDLQSYDVLNLPDTIVTSLAIRDHNANLLDEEVFPHRLKTSFVAMVSDEWSRHERREFHCDPHERHGGCRKSEHHRAEEKKQKRVI